MLKKIQHLSEGNFYGLHVTNKGRSLTLNKELRNIDSCKQAQSHIYRKEKRDLLGTLEKLYRKKYNHRFLDFQGEVPRQERTTLPRETTTSEKLNLKKALLKNLKTSKQSVDRAVERPATHGSTYSTKKDNASLSQLVKGYQEVGTLIHRTTGYTNCCVICNLPLRAHGEGHPGSTTLCNCHDGQMQVQSLDSEDNYHKPGAHVHAHIHRPEDDLFQPDEAFQTSNMQVRHEPHAKRKSVYEHRASGKLGAQDEEGKTARTLKLDKKELETKYLGERSRGSSFEEELLQFRKQSRQVTDPYPGERSRRGSLEEQRSWLLNRFRDQNRKNSLEYSDIIYLDSNSSSRRGSMEESNRYQALRNAYNKYSEMLRRNDNNDSTLSARAEYHSNKNVEDDGEAFCGLLHPDNIINHHHFLPYEAMKSNKTAQHRKHNYLDSRGHDYQNHGNEHQRAGSFGRERRGSFGHVAPLFDRAHENDASNVSHSRDMLMKLRQLLQVYHEMESEQNRYPWPRPSVPEFTTEDYEKLKHCRYLRIPKSHQNLSLMDRESFDHHVP